MRRAATSAPRRVTLAGVGAVALVALLAPGAQVASAVPGAEPLPTPSASELSESVVPITADVDAMELRTEPLEAESTDGEEKVVTLNSDILFGFDKAVIPAKATARIGELVKTLPQKAKVTVGGHTDSLGTDARNRTLSEQRAQAVAKVVTAARPDLVLTVKGFGSSEPVAPNTSGGKDDPDGRAKNRRVELRYAG